MNEKGNVMYLHNEILLSFKKDGGTDTWYNTWKSLEDIMLNKRNQTKKGHILYPSLYMQYPG